MSVIVQRLKFWVRLPLQLTRRHHSGSGRRRSMRPYIQATRLHHAGHCLESYCSLFHHHSRLPTSKNVRKMQKLYELVKSSAAAKQSWLREIQTQWRMWYTEDMDGRLVQKGVDDHKHLAVRLSKLFPTMISEEKLRGGFIKFITSSKHRCVNSTLSFKAGLTGLWAITGMSSSGL